MTRTPRPLSRLRPSGMAALFSSPPHSLNLARLSRSTDLQYVRERAQWLKLRLHALDRRFRSCLRAISSLRSQITPNPLEQLSKDSSLSLLSVTPDKPRETRCLPSKRSRYSLSSEVKCSRRRFFMSSYSVQCFKILL
jgi:hypothetical protein